MTAPTVIQAADVRAPSGTGANAPQQLAGTGTTAVANETSLTVGEMATLLVAGAAAVRFAFGTTEAAAIAACAATSPALPTYGRYDWMVGASDAFVAVEAEDGAAEFEASVWTSSGPR
jgi:hypothetical protein